MLAVPPRSIGQLDRQHTADSLPVRVLNRGDLPGIERHLLTLDPASRHTRFGSAFADSSVSAYGPSDRREASVADRRCRWSGRSHRGSCRSATHDMH